MELKAYNPLRPGAGKYGKKSKASAWSYLKGYVVT